MNDEMNAVKAHMREQLATEMSTHRAATASPLDELCRGHAHGVEQTSPAAAMRNMAPLDASTTMLNDLVQQHANALAELRRRFAAEKEEVRHESANAVDELRQQFITEACQIRVECAQTMANAEVRAVAAEEKLAVLVGQARDSTGGGKTPSGDACSEECVQELISIAVAEERERMAELVSSERERAKELVSSAVAAERESVTGLISFAVAEERNRTKELISSAVAEAREGLVDIAEFHALLDLVVTKSEKRPTRRGSRGGKAKREKAFRSGAEGGDPFSVPSGPGAMVQGRGAGRDLYAFPVGGGGGGGGGGGATAPSFNTGNGNGNGTGTFAFGATSVGGGKGGGGGVAGNQPFGTSHGTFRFGTMGQAFGPGK